MLDKVEAARGPVHQHVSTLSIVITSYNYGRYLHQCVRSSLQQTLAAEVIVVDDCSVDDSMDILSSFGARITVIAHRSQQGQGVALNHGIAAASGEIVITLDSDDWMHPNRAEHVLAAFNACPDADWLVHTVKATSGEPGDGESTTYRLPNPGTVIDDLVRHGDLAGTTSGLAFRRSLLTRIGEIPSSFSIYPDNFLMCAAGLLGHLTVIDEALSYQRVHASRASSDRSDPRDRAFRLIAMRRDLANCVTRFASQHPDRPATLCAGATWWQAKAKLQADKIDCAIAPTAVCRDLARLAIALRKSELQQSRKILIFLRELVLTLVPRPLYLQSWLLLHHGRPRWLQSAVAKMVVTGPGAQGA